MTPAELTPDAAAPVAPAEGEPKNEPPFTNPLANPAPKTPVPVHVPPTPAEVAAAKAAALEAENGEIRARGVVWAHDLLTTLRPRCAYSEGSNRLSMYAMEPGDPDGLPITSDCSSSSSGLYKWGGAPDPNKLGYAGDPWTGTLAKAMTAIAAAAALPFDLVLFGEGDGVHVAVLLAKDGDDWWTFNNGGPTGAPPSRVLLSETERWMVDNDHPGVRFLRSLL